ncbi:AIM24 family protein [Actinomadura welshii]
MRSQFFGNMDQGQQLPGHFALQNSKMLRIHLNGDVLARQGSMVAFQGQMEFDYEGSGGIGKFMKKAWTAPGWAEALIPGRVRGYGTPEEVLR